jgi:dipeptidyl aminopeptidase/acylaminoacyl peptidase
MRRRTYPGSAITIEQTLAPGANYSRYVVSYQSDGYKVYALMTVPVGPRPSAGWPVIIFNHGYIPPAQYRTTERYVAYVDAIARNGYIVFKSDYRGHGSSEGTAAGGYGSPDYTADVLNALSSVKAYPGADPQRIGMWGHSMGGQMTLRAMVLSRDIKAGVIWGGVIAPYPDIVSHWTRRPGAPVEYIPPNQRHWRQDLIAKYGTPAQNPAFWASISPNSYLDDLSGPLQLQASITDEEVPVKFSATLFGELKAAGKTTEFYQYPDDNHNISGNFAIAMQRSIAWFDKYVKGQ